MAKRRTTRKPSEPEATILIKSKARFKKELEHRIELGESILKEKITDDKTFLKLLQDYSDWSDYNLELLKQSFNNPHNEYWRAYDNSDEFAGLYVSTIGGRQTPAQRLNEFIEKFQSKIDNLTKLKNKVELLKSSVTDNVEIAEKPLELNMSQVFIVHGHDDLIKIETARFIETLGFEPIILHEQASSGKTIIEKIESYSNVGFGIVLYTPCDIGAKAGEEANLKSRARQNVVFEHGYLIGKIGRKNVCALVKENVETPNDISGVVYISLQGEWKLDLAKELRNSGYNIDMNLVI